MRYLFLLLISMPCWAKEFKFTYNMPDGRHVYSLHYKTEADTWREAFNRGANFCEEFFVDQKPLTEDRLLEILDVCVNPSEN